MPCSSRRRLQRRQRRRLAAGEPSSHPYIRWCRFAVHNSQNFLVTCFLSEYMKHDRDIRKTYRELVIKLKRTDYVQSAICMSSPWWFCLIECSGHCTMSSTSTCHSMQNGTAFQTNMMLPLFWLANPAAPKTPGLRLKLLPNRLTSCDCLPDSQQSSLSSNERCTLYHSPCIKYELYTMSTAGTWQVFVQLSLIIADIFVIVIQSVLFVVSTGIQDIIHCCSGGRAYRRVALGTGASHHLVPGEAQGI